MKSQRHYKRVASLPDENCFRSRCDPVMLMSSLLAVIKYVAWVDTRGKTGARGGLVSRMGDEQLIGGMGLV